MVSYPPSTRLRFAQAPWHVVLWAARDSTGRALEVGPPSQVLPPGTGQSSGELQQKLVNSTMENNIF